MPILGSIIKSAIDFRKKLPASKKTDNFKQQKKTLKKLLKKSSVTAFGEKYKFQEILKNKNIIEDYQKNVPIFDYNTIFNLIFGHNLKSEYDPINEDFMIERAIKVVEAGFF